MAVSPFDAFRFRRQLARFIASILVAHSRVIRLVFRQQFHILILTQNFR